MKAFGINFAITDILVLGFHPLGYWAAEHFNLQKQKRVKSGYWIYGFEIQLLGFSFSFRLNREIYLKYNNKGIYKTKN